MKKFWIFFSLTWGALVINSSFFKSENIDKGIYWFENQDKVGHFVFCAIFSWCLIKSFSQLNALQNKPLDIHGTENQSRRLKYYNLI